MTQFSKFVGEDIDLLRLDGAVIENWAAHLRQQGYAPASIRRKIIALRVFCSYWVRKGALPESPFWRVKLSFGRTEQLPRTLTEREMHALLNEARQTYSIERASGTCGHGQTPFRAYRSLRNLALVDLLFATGMRVGEVSALNIDDFLVEDAVFRVQGKGGRDRLAFIVDEETIKIQAEHFEARGRAKTESSALFLNSASARLSTQGIANVIAQFRERAGIQPSRNAAYAPAYTGNITSSQRC